MCRTSTCFKLVFPLVLIHKMLVVRLTPWVFCSYIVSHEGLHRYWIRRVKFSSLTTVLNNRDNFHCYLLFNLTSHIIPPNLTCFIKAHPVPPEVTGSLSLIHLVLWLSRRTWPLDTAQQISKDKHSDALRASDSVSGRHLPVCFIVFTCWREPGLSYGAWTMVFLRPLFRL